MATTVFWLAAIVDDPDAQVAGALRRLDPEGIDALVDRYAHRLFRYLLHLTGNRALADDLFQETWVRVLERGSQYDPRRPFIGWLLGIARHLAIDAARRSAVRARTTSLDQLESRKESAMVRAPSAGPSPFEALVARERRDRVAAAAAGLPAIHREVLFLRFQEELTLQEIARITGVPVPTVKSRLYRGLGNLALRLGGRADG